MRNKRGFNLCYKFVFLIIGLMTFTMTTQAQETNAQQDSTQSKIVSDENALYNLILSDPRNRKYLDMTKQGWLGGVKAKTLFRFGGYVQINFINDIQNTGYDYGEFIPAGIPVPTDDTNNIAWDPRTTRMTFETQTDTKKGMVNTFISFDLSGMTQPGSVQPRLRQAYISWISKNKRQSLLIGQAGSTITDGNIWPESFDLEGPNAMMYLRQVMIRYSFMLGKGETWVGQFALEESSSDIQYGEGLISVPDAIFTANMNKKWGHLRFGALGRYLTSESLDGGGKAETFGWGLTFSGQLKVKDSKDNFQFQLTGGQGVGRYLQDLGSAEDGQGAVYNQDDASLTALGTFGGFVAYQHWWADNLRTTVNFGYVSVENQDIQNDNELNNSIYSLLNLIYSPFKRMDVGLEYYYGQRVNKIETSGHANRILLGAKYSF